MMSARSRLLSMLLRDDDMLMVHFVGVPPGTADLLIVPPETLERFEGPRKYAAAVDAPLSKIGQLTRDPQRVRELLLGDA